MVRKTRTGNMMISLWVVMVGALSTCKIPRSPTFAWTYPVATGKMAPPSKRGPVALMMIPTRTSSGSPMNRTFATPTARDQERTPARTSPALPSPPSPIITFENTLSAYVNNLAPPTRRRRDAAPTRRRRKHHLDPVHLPLEVVRAEPAALRLLPVEHDLDHLVQDLLDDLRVLRPQP